MRMARDEVLKLQSVERKIEDLRRTNNEIEEINDFYALPKVVQASTPMMFEVRTSKLKRLLKVPPSANIAVALPLFR